MPMTWAPRSASTRIVVEDTTKIQAAVHGHQGRVVEGEVAVGDAFTARGNAEQRAHARVELGDEERVDLFECPQPEQ